MTEPVPDFPWSRERQWMAVERALREEMLSWADMPEEMADFCVERARRVFDIVFFDPQPIDKNWPVFMSKHIQTVVSEMVALELRLIKLERELQLLRESKTDSHD